MTTVEHLISHYREPLENFPFDLTTEWKKHHPDKKVIGCYPVYTPVEIIHAAGMLPVGVIGAGNRLEIAHADSRFQSFVCSIVKSTLELGLTEKLKFLDGIVVPYQRTDQEHSVTLRRLLRLCDHDGATLLPQRNRR